MIREGRRTDTRALLALVALAIAVRVAARVALGTPGPPTGDEGEHFNLAVSLVEGHGYSMSPGEAPALPTAYRTPGTALYLALFMWIFGAHATVARASCIIAASTSAPLVFLLTRTFASRRAALLAGVACAVYPTWVFHSTRILSESCFVPALLLALLLSVQAIDRDGGALPAAARALFAGAAWGAATLVKPLALPIAALSLAYLVFVRRRRALRLASAALVGFTLIYSPWVIRNQVTFGELIPLATEGGETLLGANNPYVLADPALYGMWKAPSTIPEYAERLRPVRGELSRSRLQSRWAIEYLRAHPAAIPALAFHKAARFLTPVTASRGVARVAVLVSYGWLLTALAAGLGLRAIQRSTALDLALLSALSMLVVTLVYWGNLTRGRVPLEVLFLPWGTSALLTIVERWRAHRAGPATSPRSPDGSGEVR